VGVALLVLGGQAHVLVEIERRDLREVEAPLAMRLDEAPIQPLGRASGGKTDDTVGLFANLFGDDLGRPVAHRFVVIDHLDEHRT
jgi:hypothetical protein